MSELKLGHLINGRYRLESILGQGGMGTVYKAHDETLKRDVALKVMSNARLGTDGRARMLREAQVVANLNHANIVAVHDAGEIGEQPYIVMEYVQGETLDIQKSERIEDVVGVALQICDALEHAHTQDIIHRDLKPENITIEPNGNLKLMDFGLARSSASRLTNEGAMMGTVFYMAPEQAMGKDVDARTDLYAFGVLLYEMLTGHLPFEADNAIAVITQHIHAPVVAPRARREDIPTHLNNLIVKLLSKSPEERPENIQEVRAVLNLSKSQTHDSDSMEFSGIDRIVRGRIIGREAEMTQARTAWKNARESHGQILLISGEPGIGKTRFTQEIITQAEFSGGRTLFGASYQGSNAPYAPYAEIVRSVLRQSASGKPDIPEHILADLLIMVPDLHAYYPDVPTNPRLEGGAEKQRIFENFSAFIEILSQTTPLLIVIDDIHWADTGTLDLTRHLSRRNKNLPILIVGTYREIEMAGSNAFRNALNDINRESHVDRIKLGRLGKEQVRQMLTALFADTITDDFLLGIYKETEGNPFFIEEVCKALVESGKLYFKNGEWHRPEMGELEIPQSVMVAIQSRVNKLPQEVQDTLRLASIIGREFDYEVLAEASDLDEDALIDCLEATERAQLIEELPLKGDTVFQFVHALIPATMLEEVSSLRKRRIHRKVANAMMKVKPEEVQAIAYHFIETGDLENGLKYAREAGDRASQVSAMQEAIKAYGQALECAEALELDDEIISLNHTLGLTNLSISLQAAAVCFKKAYALEPDPTQKIVVMVSLAGSHVAMGDGAYVPQLKEGLPILATLEKYELEYSQALTWLGRFDHMQGSYKTALDYYQKALVVAEHIEDRTGVANIYTQMCGAYQQQGMFVESNQWAEKAIAYSIENQMPEKEAAGYEFISENASLIGTFKTSIEYANKNAEIAQKYGFFVRLGWAKFVVGWANNGLGELQRSIEAFEQGLSLAEKAGDVRLEAMTRGIYSEALFHQGELEKSLSQLAASLKIAEQLDNKQLFVLSYYSYSYVYLYAGEIETADTWIEKSLRLLEGTEQRWSLINAQRVKADSLVRKGQLALAEEILTALLVEVEELGIMHEQGRVHGLLAQIASEQEKYQLAEAYFNKSLELLGSEEIRILMGRVYLERARMWQKRGDVEKASHDAREARDLFDYCGAPLELEKAKVFLAEV